MLVRSWLHSFRGVRLPPVSSTVSRNHLRPFFSLPGKDLTQQLTASCILPYHPAPLYDIVADVDSYSTFVPYCSHSRVTHWSEPDSQGNRWPTRADLHVGWGGFDEKFTSKLNCLPGQAIEAISGGMDEGDASAVFKRLVTRWSLKPISEHPTSPSTEVHLAITYHFANPLYAAVSAAVSDKVASMMVEAFKNQAAKKLIGNSRPGRL